MVSKKTKILIVDDHAILLDGIKKILSNADNYEVIGTAVSGTEALEILKTKEIDLIITDLQMPDMDGLEMIRTVRNENTSIKIIVLSLHDEAHYVKSVIKIGIQGYIHKSETSEDLLTALEWIPEGKVFMSSRINKVLMNSLNNPEQHCFLTVREIEILKLITEEFTNNEIADKLFISPRTVETHRKNIFRKTGCNSLVGLIKFAYENNISGIKK